MAFRHAIYYVLCIWHGKLQIQLIKWAEPFVLFFEGWQNNFEKIKI